MQVILFQNIERLGMQGDVVNVANGYFRNYLGPRGIAVAATEGNMKRLETKRKRLREDAERQLSAAGAVADRLKGVEIKFTMKTIDGKKLFGSVSDHEIVTRLHEAGFTEVERRNLAMHEPLKTTGAHQVRVKLLGHVEAPVTVVIEAEEGTAPAATAVEEAPKTEAAEAAEAAPVAEEAAGEGSEQ